MPAKWLDDEEMAAWRALLRAHSRLMAALDAELQEAHDLTLGDYELLLHLAEAPPEGLRMSDLAERLVLSRSGLTRRLDGLAQRGFVDRKACPSDRRGIMAVLTPQGRSALRTAAPTHVDGVRRMFVAPLSRQQLSALASALGRVADALEG